MALSPLEVLHPVQSAITVEPRLIKYLLHKTMKWFSSIEFMNEFKNFRNNFFRSYLIYTLHILPKSESGSVLISWGSICDLIHQLRLHTLVPLTQLCVAEFKTSRRSWSRTQAVPCMPVIKALLLSRHGCHPSKFSTISLIQSGR